MGGIISKVGLGLRFLWAFRVGCRCLSPFFALMRGLRFLLAYSLSEKLNRLFMLPSLPVHDAIGEP